MRGFVHIRCRTVVVIEIVVAVVLFLGFKGSSKIYLYLPGCILSFI